MAASSSAPVEIKVLIAEVPGLLAAVVRKVVSEEPDMQVVDASGAGDPLALASRGLVDVIVTASTGSGLAPSFREILFGPVPVPVLAISVDGKRIDIYGRSVTNGGGIEGLARSIREAVTRARPRTGGTS
jgi:hypothetical protein